MLLLLPTLLQCTSHNVAKIWNRVTSQHEYCRFLSSVEYHPAQHEYCGFLSHVGYHQTCCESQCRVHDSAFLKFSMKWPYAFWRCLSSNLWSLKHLQKRKVWWWVCGMQSEAWDAVMSCFFLLSFPTYPMFLQAVGSTFILTTQKLFSSLIVVFFSVAYMYQDMKYSSTS